MNLDRQVSYLVFAAGLPVYQYLSYGIIQHNSVCGRFLRRESSQKGLHVCIGIVLL